MNLDPQPSSQTPTERNGRRKDGLDKVVFAQVHI